MPDVEMVMRRSLIPTAWGRKGCASLSKHWQVEQRFAHPHHHDVEALILPREARYRWR